MKSSFLCAAVVVAASMLTSHFSHCFAQGTVFTYQGRLTSGSSAYTGVAEIQPALWDAASGGTQVAANSPSSVLVSVTNGLFVLPLDFGNAPFAGGADRYLEIQLRTVLGPFTTLTPRQKLSPTPYALRAANAAIAATANSVAAANITGTLSLAQLPGTVVTNSQAGVNLTGAFSGNGGGLSNLSAKALVLTTTNVSITTWGRNESGERIIPASLDNAHILAVSPGAAHSLALKGDGTVVAWGGGQTNDPTANSGIDYGQSIVPPGLANVTAISAGYVHSLALRADRTVIAWGWNEYNQTTVPASVNNIVEIAAAAYHNLALKADGTVVAWGTNAQPGMIDVPAGLNNVVAVSAGFYHNLVLKADGTVAVWGGANDYNQTNMPPGLNSIKAIAAGGAHSLVLRSNGTVVAWGAGQTNDPSTFVDFGQSIVPTGLSNVVAISAGVYHSLALKADGTVVGWGNTQYGGLVPTGLDNVLALGKGGAALHAMVLRKRFVGPVAWLDSDNTFNGSIQVTGDARVDGDMAAKNLRLNDGNLFLRGGSDQKNALGWHGAGKPFNGVELNGPVLFGDGGGALGTVSTNGTGIALFWDNNQRVGIGTTTPGADLSLGSRGWDSKLLLYEPYGGGGSGIGLGGYGGTLTFHLDGSGHFSFLDTSGGSELVSIYALGGAQAKVGIGTGFALPTATLDVRGSIRLGQNGEFLAPGGEENLKIIRGVISSTGTILGGEGFSVIRTGTGSYTVTFGSAFASIPTVTATAQSGIPRLVTSTLVSGSSAQFRVFDPNALVDNQFHFSAIGPR